MKRERTAASRAPEAQNAGPIDELPTEKAFVLQLARDSGPRLTTFAGRVEHLSSGRRERFATLSEFVAALGRLLAQRHR